MSNLGSEEQIQGHLGPRQGLATARLEIKGLGSENGHQPRIKIQRGRQIKKAPVLLQAPLQETRQAHLTSPFQGGSVSVQQSVRIGEERSQSKRWRPAVRTQPLNQEPVLPEEVQQGQEAEDPLVPEPQLLQHLKVQPAHHRQQFPQHFHQQPYWRRAQQVSQQQQLKR